MTQWKFYKHGESETYLDNPLDRDMLHDLVMDVVQQDVYDDLAHADEAHDVCEEAVADLLSKGQHEFLNGVRLTLELQP